MRKKEEKNSIIEICPVRNVVARFGNKWGLLVILVIGENGHMIMGIITIEDVRWENGPKESSGIGFNAGVNRVIVGRKHIGDENASSLICNRYS